MPAHISRRTALRRFGDAAAGLCLAPSALDAFGQRAQSEVRRFRSDIELVATAVTVRDAAGRLVATLDQDAFEISEDGVPQPIALFTKDRVPVSLCLALDVSESMRGRRMADAREALRQFLDNLLTPDDETALVLFNHSPNVAVSWTADRSLLHMRLDAVVPFGGTAIYDAVAAMLPLFQSRTHQRAAIVLVSDGADTASDTTLMSLRRLMIRSDVFLYAIAIDAPDARNSTRINPWPLRELTAEGGGYTEVIADSAELASATARIADELNHQYMLGYSPSRTPDSQFHTIRVVVKGGEYHVRSRRGYTAYPYRSL